MICSLLVHLDRYSCTSHTLIRVGWCHRLSLSNCHQCHHGYHKAKGLFQVLLSGLLLPYAKMIPNTAHPPFNSQIQGPARNVLTLSCPDRAHASVSLGKEERLAPSPRCFAHTWLSRALTSRNLLHSVTGYHHLDLLQIRLWWCLEGDCGLGGWKGMSRDWRVDASQVDLAPAWGCIIAKAAFQANLNPFEAVAGES